MSDLISRSELIKHFEAIQQQENVVGLEFIAMIDEIKEQPTAYDIDKVVEELAEFLEKNGMCELCEYRDKENCFEENCKKGFLKWLQSEVEE